MASKKKNKPGTIGNNKTEINFVSGTDFYIYELLLGELPDAAKSNNNKANKKQNKKIINKFKNQIKTK